MRKGDMGNSRLEWDKGPITIHVCQSRQINLEVVFFWISNAWENARYELQTVVGWSVVSIHES